MESRKPSSGIWHLRLGKDRHRVPVEPVRPNFPFFYFHQIILATTQRMLLNHSAPQFTLRSFLDSLITTPFAVPLFALLNRPRKPS